MIELSVRSNRRMWILDRENLTIDFIDIVRESKSGNTVQADYGLVMRTHTKRYSIFNDKRVADMELTELRKTA